MADRFQFDGTTAVITGAASGIGRALAHGLAKRGCRLALADIDRDGAEAVAAEIGSANDRISVHQLDVSDREAVKALPAAVRDAHGGAALIFNNAGVAVGGNFDELSEADFDWLMSINFQGVVDMTRAFLPLLREADQGHITNISSLFGLIAPAGQTAYCASKFAVRGFTDALRHELANTSVGVTTVHPGGVATNIAKRARVSVEMNEAELEAHRQKADSLLTMPPPKAAEIILRAVERRAPRVLVGNDAKIASVIERFMPATYWSIIKTRLSDGREEQ